MSRKWYFIIVIVFGLFSKINKNNLKIGSKFWIFGKIIILENFYTNC